jgi:hypothetical protein
VAAKHHSATFDCKLEYAWLAQMGSGGTFLFIYSDEETESIFGIPLKFYNF